MSDPTPLTPHEIAERRRLRERIVGPNLALDLEDLLRLLPHRPPLLMLDRVLLLRPGFHAVAEKLVTGDEAGLAAARHGFVFPSTFAVEALSQLSQLVASGLSIPEERNPRAPWPELEEIESVVVHREITEPTAIHLSVSRLAEGTPGLIPFAGEATIEGGVYLETRLWVRGGGATHPAPDRSPDRSSM